MAIKAGIEAALPAEKRDKVLVVTHGIPSLMTAYLEVFVEEIGQIEFCFEGQSPDQ